MMGYPTLDLTFGQLQEHVGEWSRRNFPNNQPYHPLLGLVEEVGELSHSFLKSEQGIRGTIEEHHAAKVDAVGDILVYLADFCSRNDIDMQDAIETTWGMVQKRDWQKNRGDGVTK
jgi:NTP pyrophosphatase (non-canonical NTP hydrolase)